MCSKRTARSTQWGSVNRLALARTHLQPANPPHLYPTRNHGASHKNTLTSRKGVFVFHFLGRYSLPRPLLAGSWAAVERPDEMTVEDTLCRVPQTCAARPGAGRLSSMSKWRRIRDRGTCFWSAHGTIEYRPLHFCSLPVTLKRTGRYSTRRNCLKNTQGVLTMFHPNHKIRILASSHPRILASSHPRIL